MLYPSLWNVSSGKYVNDKAITFKSDTFEEQSYLNLNHGEKNPTYPGINNEQSNNKL